MVKPFTGRGETRPLPRNRTIHLWKVDLTLPEPSVARLTSLLSPQELIKVHQFRYRGDQYRFSISRGALRLILAGYLGDEPSRLTFTYGQHGKPLLDTQGWGREIRFNLSHCSDLTLVAVSSAPAVGIDVERIRDIPELDQMLGRYFSREERTMLESSPEPSRTQLFLQLWTRREAAAKALGLDLSAAFSDIEIPAYPLGAGLRVSLPKTQIGTSPSSQGYWHVQDIPMDQFHVGALCSEGESPRVIFLEFSALLG